MVFRKHVKRLRDHVTNTVRENAKPESIAAGFAVGIAIGVLPTPGFGIILALLLVVLFPKLSKLAVFAGLAVLNPFIELPLDGLSLMLGSWITGTPLTLAKDIGLIDQLFSHIWQFLLGNLIITVVLTTAAYVIVLWLARSYQARRERKARKRMEITRRKRVKRT